MNKVKRYTKKEALKIINKDDQLKQELADLKPLAITGEIDHGFGYGNFFNKVGTKNKIVIQWLTSASMKAKQLVLGVNMHEITVNNIEEALVVLRDIDEANGDLEP